MPFADGVTVPVLINASGGTAASMGDKLSDQVKRAFGAAKLEIDLRLLDGDAMTDAVKNAAGAPLVVVGGGDGTLGCAAGVIAGTETTLGILPLGTRNHLARELGIPLDLPGAAKAIAASRVHAIDIARVNGRAFVNNASIGLYPDMVRDRENLPAPKWLAALPASLAALGRLRHHRLRLKGDKGRREVVTPMLLVGNNRYSLDPAKLGQREALDDGVLSVYALASHGRLALLGLALRTLAGRTDPKRDFAAIGDVAELTVTGGSHHIDVALDGELTRLTMPLEFKVEPKALRVVAGPDFAP